MAIVNKKCFRCGKMIYGVHHGTMFCPECKKQKSKEQNRRYKAIQNGENPFIEEQKSRFKQHKKTMNDILREAKKLNMSYGQYVALKMR